MLASIGRATLTVIQGVVGVWLVEQHNETVDDGIHVKNRLPVLSQDVEAHSTLPVDVWVIDRCHALGLWRLVRISFGDRYLEHKRSTIPESRVWGDSDVKKHQVAFVRPIDLGNLARIELSNVCGKKRSTGSIHSNSAHKTNPRFRLNAGRTTAPQSSSEESVHLLTILDSALSGRNLLATASFGLSTPTNTSDRDAAGCWSRSGRCR